MPQAKNPEQTPKPKGRNPRVSKSSKETTSTSRIEEQLKCHIHDDAHKLSVNDIHYKVCVNNEPLIKHINGKFYCFFHLPTKDKDMDKFEELFHARLDKIEKEIQEAKLLVGYEQDEALSRISYDFRYVWFPLRVDLASYKFSVFVSFNSATFCYFANFNSATFLDRVSFSSATFLAKANFTEITFSKSVFFNSTNFLDEAHFYLTTFSEWGNFNLAKFMSITLFKSAKFLEGIDFISVNFSSYTSFSKASFMGKASFRSAKFASDADFNNIIFEDDISFFRTRFGKLGSTTFLQTNFSKDVYFDRARFRNDVNFNSAIFGKDSDVFFRHTFFVKKADFQYCTAEGYLRFSKLRGNDYQFDFQEAAFEKASRVSFHTLRLCPNWFVNVDARKFIFTDIRWQNLRPDWKNRKITAELANLDARDIKEQNKRLLEIAARQLAVNSEENNRYEEAAKFRYMAMETKRLEELKQFSFSRYLIWLYKWTSGYGESWSWAAFVLVVVLLFFGLLYATPLAKFDYGEKADDKVIADVIEKPEDWTKKYDARFHSMKVGEGLVHSLYVAALQRPEPKAADTTTRLFVILETIFAPLQAALLALAIRRKFMR